MYWHSERFHGKDYHSTKRELALKQGIKLIEVWEDDWRTQPDIAKAFLLRDLGHASTKAYPENTYTTEIDARLAMDFLQLHQLAHVSHADVFVGVFDHAESNGYPNSSKGLIAVVAVNLPKSSAADDAVELSCFATLPNIDQATALRQVTADLLEISDLRKGVTLRVVVNHDFLHGSMLEVAGWKLCGALPSDFVYAVQLERITVDDLTPSQRVSVSDDDRIWDSGCDVYAIQL